MAPLRTRTVIVGSAILAALAMGSAAGGVHAAPARPTAPTQTPVIAAPNGTAGLPMTVTVIAPKLANQSIDLAAELGSTSADIDSVDLDAKGRGAVSWTPPYAGTWSITAPDADIPIQASSPVVGAMPTTTQIIVPSKATRFEPMNLVAIVDTGATVRTLGKAAAQQSTQVQGTVTFHEVYLGRLGAVDVKALPGQAVATFSWTPPQYGEYAFYAVFEPASIGDDGTAVAGGPVATAGSITPVAHLTVLERPVVVAMRMPQLLTVGQPAVVTAELPFLYQGTVSFLVDGKPISPDRETVAGRAATVWTPLEPGLHDVSVLLQSDRFPRLEREVLQQVDVRPEPVPNPISVSPIVKGEVQDPWEDGAVLTWQGGQRIPLVMSTATGAPVNLAQRGGCLISGSVLVTPPAGGGCMVTFSTVGSGGMGPNSATVIISSEVEPQYGKAGEKGAGRVKDALAADAAS